MKVFFGETAKHDFSAGENTKAVLTLRPGSVVSTQIPGMLPGKTFAERIIQFNRDLVYEGKALPAGIRVMNPFRESSQALRISDAFYSKYYSDNRKRFAILGINPGRFGAGLTGIPFTDPKRLITECNIPYEGKPAHEPSSAFVYEVIHAFGGPEAFYQCYHINSLCPLGFTKTEKAGKEKNYNYYDSRELSEAVTDFIISNLHKQIALGIDTNVCVCLGTGKNEAFFTRLNEQHHFFKKIIALEHPRFIMQYKSAAKRFYIDKYVDTLNMLKHSL